jgi:MFS transporter, DHA1 family, inner membrane transport protein
MTRKELQLLIILAAVNFTNIMDFMIMMPLQEFLVPDFKITPTQFGLLVSSYAFSAFTASLTATFLIDRFDRKKALVFAFSGLVVGTLICGMANSYLNLLLARIITGLFGGLISAQVLSIVGDLFPYEKRGRAMGVLMSAFALASVAGVPAGLYVATHFHWQVPFIWVGLFGLVVLGFVLLKIPSVRGHIREKKERKKFRVYQSVYASSNQQRALLLMFTLIFAHFVTIPFIAPYLEMNVGFKKEQLPMMYFAGGLISMISSPLIGKAADRFGKQKIMALFLLLSTIPVYLITHLPPSSVAVVLVVTTSFFLFAGGRMIPAQAIITSVVPGELRGGFMNLSASIQQLGVGLAALTGGVIITKSQGGTLENYDIVGYLSIGVALLCLVILFKVKPMENE